GDLARTHRVYAVDLINDAGRSVPDGRPVRSREDLMGWLDAVCTGLGLATTALCGHSYGGWIVLSYALHAPARISRLALLDPTLVLVAEKTRAHDPARVAANAKALLPDVTTAVLPGATHHTIPMVDAARLNGALTRFLGG